MSHEWVITNVSSNPDLMAEQTAGLWETKQNQWGHLTLLLLFLNREPESHKEGTHSLCSPSASARQPNY